MRISVWSPDVCSSDLLGIELARYCDRINDVQSGGGLSSWRLRLIDERLHDVRDAPTLTELAELCKLSVRQLTRGFRASRGCSIGSYVADSRSAHDTHILLRAERVKAVSDSKSEGRRVGKECWYKMRSGGGP